MLEDVESARVRANIVGVTYSVDRTHSGCIGKPAASYFASEETERPTCTELARASPSTAGAKRAQRVPRNLPMGCVAVQPAHGLSDDARMSLFVIALACHGRCNSQPTRSARAFSMPEGVCCCVSAPASRRSSPTPSLPSPASLTRRWRAFSLETTTLIIDSQTPPPPPMSAMGLFWTKSWTKLIFAGSRLEGSQPKCIMGQHRGSSSQCALTTDLRRHRNPGLAAAQLCCQ